MSYQSKNEQERMLFDIGTVGFLLVDLTLYLDTHPYDREAMEYFNHYSHIQQGMMRCCKILSSDSGYRRGLSQRMEMGSCSRSVGRSMLVYVEL